MSNTILTLTEENFDEVINNPEQQVLVDFWAEWCGPCKMIAPLLDEVAEELEGRIVIGKVNVDQNSAIAQRLGIRGIPMLFLFKAGEIVATHVGALSKSQLNAFIGTNSE